MALDDASAGLNGNGDGGGGEDPSKEASSSSPSTTTNGGLERRSSRSSSNAGKKCIVLKSPVGGEPAVYDWPLKKGKGSVRKSEVRESAWIMQLGDICPDDNGLICNQQLC